MMVLASRRQYRYGIWELIPVVFGQSDPLGRSSPSQAIAGTARRGVPQDLLLPFQLRFAVGQNIDVLLGVDFGGGASSALPLKASFILNGRSCNPSFLVEIQNMETT